MTTLNPNIFFKEAYVSSSMEVYGESYTVALRLLPNVDATIQWQPLQWIICKNQGAILAGIFLDLCKINVDCNLANDL